VCAAPRWSTASTGKAQWWQFLEVSTCFHKKLFWCNQDLSNWIKNCLLWYIWIYMNIYDIYIYDIYAQYSFSNTTQSPNFSAEKGSCFDFLIWGLDTKVRLEAPLVKHGRCMPLLWRKLLYRPIWGMLSNTHWWWFRRWFWLFFGGVAILIRCKWAMFIHFP
jgi:hypothetical protein